MAFTQRDIDLAWIAGFFDGEGSTTYRPISYASKRPDRPGFGRSMVMSISQVNRSNLGRVQRTLGGVIQGPFKQKNARDCWHWRLHKATDVRDSVRALWPHLGDEKKLQALRAIRAYVRDGVRSRKERSTRYNSGIRGGYAAMKIYAEAA
jgi:hypothetical protein